MSIYADLVCPSCSQSFFLGKQLWNSTDDGGSRVHGYWHGSAGDGANWASDELMFALFQFLARHAGHRLRVLSESELGGLKPCPEPFFQPDTPPDELNHLSPGGGPALLVSSGQDRGYELGRLVTREGASHLFSRYLDCRSRPRAFAPLWSLLARSQTRGESLRVVGPDPGWRTSTVLALARCIHDDRAWDRMCILADALQDAGCEDSDVLSHCREPGRHARGCWVIGLILGVQ